LILIAFVIGVFLVAAMSVVLALPAGLFLMLLMSELHNVSPTIPTIGYGTAYTISLLLTVWLLFVRPSVPLSTSSS
jgi:hypothetical protein